MNHAAAGDVVITHDIGLASTLLRKGVLILHPRGKILTDEEMDAALFLRYAAAKERRRGNFGKGPKSITKKDAERFKANLIKILSKIKGIL